MATLPSDPVRLIEVYETSGHPASRSSRGGGAETESPATGGKLPAARRTDRQRQKMSGGSRANRECHPRERSNLTNGTRLVTPQGSVFNPGSRR